MALCGVDISTNKLKEFQMVDGRLMVNVDRTGSGSGGSGTASESKQIEMIGKLTNICGELAGTLDVNIVGGSTSGKQYGVGDDLVTEASGTLFLGITGDNSFNYVAVDASGRLEINDISGTVEVSNNALTLLEGTVNNSMVDVSNDALVSLKGAINNDMVDVSNDALVSLKGAINNDMVDVSNDALVSLKGAINSSMVDVSNDALVSLKGAINSSMVDVSVGNTVNVNITGGSTSGKQYGVGDDLVTEASGTLFLGVTGDNSFNYVAVDASGRLEINDISGTVEVSNNALTLLEGTVNNSMVDVSNDALVSLKGAINNDMVDVSNDALVSLKGAINSSMVDVSNDALVSLKGAINSSMVDVSVGNTVNVNITGGSTSGKQYGVGDDLVTEASGTLFLGVTGDNSFNYVAVDASGRLEINDISGTVEVSNNALTLLEGTVNNSMVDVSNDALVSLKGAINNDMVDVSNDALVSLKGAINSSMVDVSNDALVSLKGAINSSMVDVSVGNTVNVNITGGSTSGKQYGVGDDLVTEASGTLFLGVTGDNSFNYVAVDASGRLEINDISGTVEVSNNALTLLEGTVNNSMVDVSNDALVSLKGAINNDMVDVSNDALVSLKGAINNSMVDVSNDALVSLKGAINNDMVDVSVGNTVNVNITGGSTSGKQYGVGDDLVTEASGTLFLGVTGDNSFNYVAVDASGRLEINDISGTVEVSNNALTLLEGTVNNSMVDVSNDALVSLKGAINNDMVDVSNDALVSLKGAINNDMVDVSNDALVSLKGAINNSMVDVSNDALVSLKGAINNDMVDVSVGNTVNVNITGGSTSGKQYGVGDDLVTEASGTLFLGVTGDNSFNYVAVDNSGHLQVDIRSQRMAVQEITTAPDISFSSNKIDSSVNFTTMDFNIENFKDFNIYIRGTASGELTELAGATPVTFNINDHLDVCGQISYDNSLFIDLSENYFMRPVGLDDKQLLWTPSNVNGYTPSNVPYSSASGFKGIPLDSSASEIYSIISSFSSSGFNYYTSSGTTKVAPFFTPHFKTFRLKTKLAERMNGGGGPPLNFSAFEIVDLSGSIFSKS